MTTEFRFKQFIVKHDRCAMKVGTDGVLLGSWVSPEGNRALDIGCGTGLIALMLAQRNPNLNIIGIDIDEEAVEQAKENTENSRWNERIEIKKHDFNDDFLSSEPFDLIVSNPPFYKEDTNCPDQTRNKARHSSSLPISVLMEKSSKLLSPQGKVAVIVPYSAATDTISEAAIAGLYLRRRTDVKTTPRKAAIRVLLEFSRDTEPATRNELLLRDETGEWSKEYKLLTQDFYL